MATSDRDIALRAFASAEWRSAADALFQATGVTVTVVDLGSCEVLSGGNQCGCCPLASEIDTPGPATCFDECPDASAGPGRLVCRSGLATLHAPVFRRDRPVAHVMVGGFVTSTRERRGLYEKMLARGMKEATARRALKALPVIARRQAESYLQMALATARTVLDATADRVAATDRVEELRLFVSAGRQVASTERLDADALSAIAEEAVALVGGDAGAILRPRGALLEVVARTASWRGPIGALVPRAATASGRAAETRRTVVAPARAGSGATLAMPLAIGERLLGVLEVRLADGEGGVAQDRVSRLGRFGQFVAIALEREDEREAVERAMRGYAELNELAAALGGQTDLDGVSRIALDVVERGFGYQIAGLTLTSWGRDLVDVVIKGEGPERDVRHVLEVVSGRDVTADPFEQFRSRENEGPGFAPDSDEQWAIASAELAYGDLHVGTLFVARCDGERYARQDRALLEGIAAHTGAAFGRAALFTRIRDDYAKTIAALSATLDMGERAPAGHAGRVMDYAMLIGEELGLGFEAVDQLRFAGLLHDIGKTGIDEEILVKPSRLSPDELERVQQHASLGATIVDQIDFLRSLTPIILHHHERWDGTGYPHGLRGDDIPLLARILAVADSFDAMTTERPFQERLTIVEAKTELEATAGTQFDPDVVGALVAVLERQALAGATGLFAHQQSDMRADLPA